MTQTLTVVYRNDDDIDVVLKDARSLVFRDNAVRIAFHTKDKKSLIISTSKLVSIAGRWTPQL